MISGKPRSRMEILAVWGAVAVACTVATVLGYTVLGALLAVAAGGILAMLADTMMPEAFENGGADRRAGHRGRLRICLLAVAPGGLVIRAVDNR